MGSYREDRSFANLFIPEMKRLIGPHLLCESTLEVDTQCASDLVILKARDINIACRVRRPGYLEWYRWEFTLRAYRDSGAKTELEKVQAGWGDWMCA